jgi:hypothetical protein
MTIACTQFTDRDCSKEDCCMSNFNKISETLAFLRDAGVPDHELDMLSLLEKRK